MYGKISNAKAQKPHSGRPCKSGFTLVELSVVLALLAILATMIGSFSVLMSGFASENKAEYEFLEEHATLKEKICTWAAENDVSGCVFTANADGTLTVTENSTQKSVSFADSVLSLGGEQQASFDAIDGVIFTSNGKIVKCVTYRIAKNGKRSESSFVFALRCGEIGEVAENE